MEPVDLLAEVNKFLGVTLAHESLSEHAETCRRQLVSRIALGEVLPQAYIDMNGTGYCKPIHHQITDCYELFDPIPANKQNIPDGYVNNLYNNLSSRHEENSENIYANNDPDTDNYVNIKNPNQYEENAYIKPSSSLANTPVSIKPHVPLSNSNSERNSIISLKKDSTDRTSDSSSFTSGSTRHEESPEVLDISASALRHAATKCGTLGRKEKVMFMYPTKFYWAAVVNQTLFLFTNKKALKPQFDLNISGYKARPVAICSNNKDFKFELVCPGKKTHQFIAEKQWEMDKWISAINSAGKGSETMKEWTRDLPSPPSEPYEETDSVSQARPLLEAETEYQLPDTVTRQSSNVFRKELAHLINAKFISPSNHLINKAPEKFNSEQSLPGKFLHSPKEVRRLPLLPTQQETYDHPPSVRPVPVTQTPPSPELYECVQEELYQCINSQNARSLPLLPHEKEVPQQEVYDLPEPKVRPVFKPDVIIQEEFYSVIDNSTNIQKPISQEALYKNVEDNFKHEETDGRNYDNLMPNPEREVKQEGFPEKETDQECIYYMITEQRVPHTPSTVPVDTPSNNTKKLVNSPKPPNAKAKLIEEIQLKCEEKKLSSVINNIATINSKQFSIKPQLKGVKPPIVNKT